MRTMIAIPAMEMMHSWTVQNLCDLRPVGETKAEFIIRMQVDTARNLLAKRAVEGGYDRILWIDSDMVFAPDMMEILSADLDAGWDVISGLYFKRAFPLEPVIYKHIDVEKPEAVPYWDYPKDTAFPIAGCGFGGVMMKTEVLMKLQEPPFQPFLHLSEDLSFCVRMHEAGYKVGCDSRVKLGHWGSLAFGEQMYKHPADKAVSHEDN